MNKVDLFILGGGLSGVAAAIGAARCGASVILAERNFLLGGTATASLVGPLQTFHSPSGRVIGGVAQEIIDTLVAAGASPGHLPDPVGFAPSVTPVNPDVLKIVLNRMLKDKNVHVLFGHSLRDVLMNADSIASITLENQQGGENKIGAKYFIDASGNGDLTHSAGATMDVDPDCQPMSLIFMMDRVNETAITAYQKSHPNEFYMPPDASVLDRGYIGVSGFFRHIQDAIDAGRLTLPRDRLLFFGGVRPGEIVVNTTRVTGYHGLDGKEVSEAMCAGLEQVRQLAAFMTGEVPGFENARLSRVADQIGVRETRRLIGRYVMNENDVRETAQFDDVIAKGAYPMDIHLAAGSGIKSIELEGKRYYDIPLRSLLNKSVRNLLTVGKCISVTHEGFSSTRVMPTCMAIGQAGGVAAALSCSTNKDFEELTQKIQDTLRKQNAIIFDEDVIPGKPGE